LILHGTQDDNVNIAEAQELYEKLQTAGATVSFVKVNDAHLFRTPEARRELAIETLAFFNRNLVTAR
jgi:dipeptidyl aminopeptidase/acylaminoacyl peptidase